MIERARAYQQRITKTMTTTMKRTSTTTMTTMKRSSTSGGGQRKQYKLNVEVDLNKYGLLGKTNDQKYSKEFTL